MCVNAVNALVTEDAYGAISRNFELLIFGEKRQTKWVWSDFLRRLHKHPFSTIRSHAMLCPVTYFLIEHAYCILVTTTRYV